MKKEHEYEGHDRHARFFDDIEQAIIEVEELIENAREQANRNDLRWYRDSQIDMSLSEFKKRLKDDSLTEEMAVRLFDEDIVIDLMREIQEVIGSHTGGVYSIDFSLPESHPDYALVKQRMIFAQLLQEVITKWLNEKAKASLVATEKSSGIPEEKFIKTLLDLHAQGKSRIEIVKALAKRFNLEEDSVRTRIRRIKKAGRNLPI